jgi:hypothetical protein
MKCNNQIFI